MNHLSHHLDLLTRQYGFYADVASGSIVVCHMRLSSGAVEGLTDPRSKLKQTAASLLPRAIRGP